METDQTTVSPPSTPNSLARKRPGSCWVPRKPLPSDSYVGLGLHKFDHSPDLSLHEFGQSPESIIWQSPCDLSDGFEDARIKSNNTEDRVNSLGLRSTHYRSTSDTKVPLIASSYPTPKSSTSLWSHEPQPIKKKSTSRKLFTLGDVILTLLPVTFLVLSECASRLNGTRTDGNAFGEKVVRASKLGPTIFPIVFAAVAGRTAQVLVRFYAGRGATLGRLEMLLSSQTVWHTFESQILLRRLSIVGAHVLLLWMLSPLGGQAALYVLDTQTATNETSALVRYLDTWRLPTGDRFNFASNAMNSLYTASLLASDQVKNGPRDTWGNIKIPRLDICEPGTSSTDEDWLIVPEITAVEDYTSLVGIPFVGLNSGASNFTMETSYMSLTCDAPVVKDIHDHSWFTGINACWKNDPEALTVPENKLNASNWVPFFYDSVTFQGSTPREEMVEFGQVLPGMNETLVEQNLAMTANALFGSRWLVLGKEDKMVLMNCSVTQEYVQSMVYCPTDQQCKVEKMRRSQLQHPSSKLTPLDAEYTNQLFCSDFPIASGQPYLLSSTSSERFLSNTTKFPFEAQTQGISPPATVDLSTVQASTLAARLTLLVNTFYQVSINTAAFSGHLSTNLSLYGPEVWPLYNTSGISLQTYNNAPMISKAVNATVAHEYEIYGIRRGWMVALIVSSLILFITGVVGLVLKIQVAVPDMFGYVSSMTYHNPFVSLPPGCGPLDGMERARALRDMKVMVADIRPGEDVGHMALVSLHDGGEDVEGGSSPDVAKLNKRRSYI